VGWLRGSRSVQVFLVLLLFTVGCTWKKRHAVGEDLSSSYVGCRIVAAGQGSHLYAHDPVVFSIVRDPMWNTIADRAGFAPLGLLHPYVQTPLWAFSLEPVCTRTTFRTFCHLFLLLTMLCTAGTIWLITRYWAPGLFHPLPVALLCVGLYLTEPFRYGVFLTQTHIIFVFLSVLGLVLAERGRPMWGGAAVALAAAVKITPGFLLMYWLMARKKRAAISFVAWSLLLVALTVVSTGPALFVAYLHEMAEVSNVLLVAFNNQSLPAVVMGPRFASWELFDWRIHHLPAALKVVSSVLSLAVAAFGGWMDRRGSEEAGPASPPYGAVFTLIGVTMLTPIAWNHYYILLLLPVVLLLAARQGANRWIWMAFAAAIFLLNVRPIAYDAVNHVYWAHSILRSQFYAGVLALVALSLLRYRLVRHDATTEVAVSEDQISTSAAGVLRR
jgi:hypothetical protein